MRPHAWHPATVFLAGFAAIIATGAFLLTLPLSSRSGQWTPFLDAAFTATSAVCVTGLVVVDTGTYWSAFGQAVILALFQVGGVGFMTSSTVLLLLGRRRATLRDRVLLREALGVAELGSVLRLARNIVIFTVIAEAIGAALLTARFLGEVDAGQALWWGVFHSVSGFNNAGFDLFGRYRSLASFTHDPLMLLTLAALFVVGGISYSVVDDIARHRRFGPLALDTKLVLTTMAGVSVAGTLGLLFTERNNAATFGSMEIGPRVLNAFFQAVSRTAGFSTVDVGKMTEDSLFLLMGLMYIGGAAGSTAGGIKVQTFSLLLCAIVAAIRGLDEVEAFHRRVPTIQVLRALSVALLLLALVFVTTLTLAITEGLAFHDLLFEAISALATVGYSTGITPELSPAGRVTLILAMFIGRLGPLTFILALTTRSRRISHRWTQETIKIG